MKLAEILNVKQSTLANWESGYRNPNIIKAIDLANALETTVESLYK